MEHYEIILENRYGDNNKNDTSSKLFIVIHDNKLNFIDDDKSINIVKDTKINYENHRVYIKPSWTTNNNIKVKKTEGSLTNSNIEGISPHNKILKKLGLVD